MILNDIESLGLECRKETKDSTILNPDFSDNCVNYCVVYSV